MNKSTSVYQDAIRLLYILVNGAENIVDESDSKIEGIFHGKARLYAMDFWVRYPDYFAHELLLNYEESGNDRFLKQAEMIFKNHEPDLRRNPMIRYLFGAFENLNNTLAVLVSKGLIKGTGKKSKNNIQQYDYLIYKKAYEIVDSATNDFPILSWYEERSKLVVEIAGQSGGSSLKDRQYEHIEYAKTKLGGTIPSIKDEVLVRIEQLISTPAVKMSER